MAHILVIDDSRSVAAYVAHHLRDNGHDVCEAATGTEGFRLMSLNRFDLVITDIYMPDLDGLELLMSVRQHQLPTPVIAMSTNDGPADVLGVARRIGACLCLKKPFDPQHLLQAVSSVLEGEPNDASTN